LDDILGEFNRASNITSSLFNTSKGLLGEVSNLARAALSLNAQGTAGVVTSRARSPADGTNTVISITTLGVAESTAHFEVSSTSEGLASTSSIRLGELPADRANTMISILAERIAESSILFFSFTATGDDFTDSSTMRTKPASGLGGSEGNKGEKADQSDFHFCWEIISR